MWMEKIFKVWALSNQAILKRFSSYEAWLTSQIIKSVDDKELVDINQSIPINQICPTKASIFLRVFLIFP